MPYQGNSVSFFTTQIQQEKVSVADGLQSSPSLTFIGDTNNGIFSPEDDNIAITTDGTERLRVTSTGNVGIGTTDPETFLDIPVNTTTKNTVQFGSFGIQSFSNGNGFLSVNGYWDGTQWIYRKNGYSSLIQFDAGNILLRTLPSGTAGGTNTIDTRLIILNNGNIGIGTDSASYKLEVLGDIRFNNNMLISSGSGTNIDHIWHDDNTAYSLPGTWNFVSDRSGKTSGNSAVLAGGFFNMADTGTASQRLQITGGAYISGSVGIGWTSPLSKLSINSAGNFPAITIPDSTNPRYSVGFGSINVTNIGQRLDFYVGDSLSNTTNLSESHIRMSLAANGNVGIGTTNPSSKLDILGTGDGTELLRFSTEREWVFRQKQSDVDSRLDLQSKVANKSFTISSSSDDPVATFYSASNANASVVGIGTTTVYTASKLHVHGGTIVTANILYSINQDAPYLVAATTNQTWTGATTSWATFGLQHRIKSDDGGTPRVTIDGSSGEYFCVKNGGNVGIGTTNPQYKLDVLGDTNFIGQFISTGVVNENKPAGIFKNSTAGALVQITSSDSIIDRTKLGLSGATYGGLVLGSSTASHYHQRLIFVANRHDTTNNIVAGGISAVYNQSLAATATSVRDATGAAIDFINTDRTNKKTAIQIAQSTNGSALPSQTVYISDTGNIGIGGISPNFKLHLSGTHRFDYPVGLGTTAGNSLVFGNFFYTNNNGSYIQFKATRLADGDNWTTASNKILCVTDVTEQGYIEFNPSGDNYGIGFGRDTVEYMRIENGGRVGIGTTDPQGILHISSGTSGDCELILEADTDNNNEGDNPRIILRQDGGGSQSGIGHGILYNQNSLVISNSVSNGGGIYLATNTGTSYADGVARLTITSTGNVGIANTTPANLFEIGESYTSDYAYLDVADVGPRRYYRFINVPAKSTGTGTTDTKTLYVGELYNGVTQIHLFVSGSYTEEGCLISFHKDWGINARPHIASYQGSRLEEITYHYETLSNDRYNLWISFTYNENVSLNAGANIRMDITSLSSQGRFLVPTTPPAPTLSETNRIYNVDVMGGHIILFNISDDTFFSHTPQRKGGVLTITCYGAADIETFPQQVGSGIVFYDIGPSPLVQEWVDVNNGIEVSTSSSSTITDFTDGRLTVIARDGYLTFANRLNGTRSLRLSFS